MTENEAIEILEGALIHFGNANLLHRAMKAGIDALKEKQEQSNAWISVNDRLPECDKYGEVYVLVCMDDEFIATTTYIENEGFELWAESGEVAHWMPLPEPPKEVQP